MALDKSPYVLQIIVTHNRSMEIMYSRTFTVNYTQITRLDPDSEIFEAIITHAIILKAETSRVLYSLDPRHWDLNYIASLPNGWASLSDKSWCAYWMSAPSGTHIKIQIGFAACKLDPNHPLDREEFAFARDKYPIKPSDFAMLIERNNMKDKVKREYRVSVWSVKHLHSRTPSPIDLGDIGKDLEALQAGGEETSRMVTHEQSEPEPGPSREPLSKAVNERLKIEGKPTVRKRNTIKAPNGKETPKRLRVRGNRFRVPTQPASRRTRSQSTLNPRSSPFVPKQNSGPSGQVSTSHYMTTPSCPPSIPNNTAMYYPILPPSTTIQPIPIRPPHHNPTPTYTTVSYVPAPTVPPMHATPAGPQMLLDPAGNPIPHSTSFSSRPQPVGHAGP